MWTHWERCQHGTLFTIMDKKEFQRKDVHQVGKQALVVAMIEALQVHTNIFNMDENKSLKNYPDN